MAKKKAKPSSSVPTKFAVGNKVRVKPGTTGPDFDDIPLGGWAGTITKVDAGSNPPTYLIMWNSHTIKHMPPVYRNRCAREDMNVVNMWLSEEDFALDDGSPVQMEQPTAIHTRPQNPDDQDDRVRAVFGLTGKDPLPKVDEESLTAYHSYLEWHLTFPIPGTNSYEVDPMEDGTESITVWSLADADGLDEMYGLFCVVGHGKRARTVPLGEFQVPEENPNHLLVSDYRFWFWNWR